MTVWVWRDSVGVKDDSVGGMTVWVGRQCGWEG